MSSTEEQEMLHQHLNWVKVLTSLVLILVNCLLGRRLVNNFLSKTYGLFREGFIGDLPWDLREWRWENKVAWYEFLFSATRSAGTTKFKRNSLVNAASHGNALHSWSTGRKSKPRSSYNFGGQNRRKY